MIMAFWPVFCRRFALNVNGKYGFSRMVLADYLND
jgi:hypothetical protein